jgi:hypothetical protein
MGMTRSTAPRLGWFLRRDILDPELCRRCRAGLLTQGVLGVAPDPFAPHRGPLGPSPDRERAIENAPALVPGPLA